MVQNIVGAPNQIAHEVDVLSEENRQSRQMIEFLTRHCESLQSMIADKKLSPSRKRELAEQVSRDHGISLRRACRLLGLARSTCWYVPAGDHVAAGDAVPLGKDFE